MSSKTGKSSTATLPSVKRPSDPTKDEQEPAKKKINMTFGTNKLLKSNNKSIPQKTAGSLSIKLSSKSQKTSEEVKVIPKSKKAAAVFDESSDSEPEEMPMEARMRMKNIGRNTPTSAGPNSFNKGKLGFVDGQKSWEAQQQILLQKLKTSKSPE